MLKALTQKVAGAQGLIEPEVTLAVDELVNESVSVEAKAEFLIALAKKGETPEEIAFFARELRARAVQPPISPETRAREILDVVGTGGDHLNTFNISTTVALIAASAGISVAKHGNRAVTSKSGSADVLDALGININLGPEAAAASLREEHFAFFFAPNYHPAFRHIGPARKLCAARGQRTLFNFLGPLLNPAQPSALLIGTPNPNLCEPMARVLQSLGARRAMVVSGSVSDSQGTRYFDELSILGDTFVAEFYQERAFATSQLSPKQFPLQRATLEDLAGGNPQENAELIRRLLSGKDRGPKREAVLLNAAAALFVAGRTKTMSDGWDLAAELIDSGKAMLKLKALS